MSFMSFDYAMRAAEAQLSFQDSQGRNMKDANERVSQVGTQNASSKDKLVRDKIQAEYEMKTTEVDAKLKDDLLKLAEEKKQNSMIAAVAVTAGTVVGGWLDHALGEIGNAAGTDIGGQEVNPRAKALGADQQGGGWLTRGSDIEYSGQSFNDAFSAEKKELGTQETTLRTTVTKLNKDTPKLQTDTDKLKLDTSKLVETNKQLKGPLDGAAAAKLKDTDPIEFMMDGKLQKMTVGDAKALFNANGALIEKNTKTIDENTKTIDANVKTLGEIMGPGFKMGETLKAGETLPPDFKGTGQLEQVSNRLTFVNKIVDKQSQLGKGCSLTCARDLGNGKMGVIAFNKSTGTFMAFKVDKKSGECTVGAMLTPDQVAKMTQDHLMSKKPPEMERQADNKILIKDPEIAKLYVTEKGPKGETFLKTPAEFSAAHYQPDNISPDAQAIMAETFRSDTGKTAMQDYLRQTNESFTGENASNQEVGGAAHPSAFNITPAYHDFAEKACSIVSTDGVREQMKGLNMSDTEIEDLAGGWLQNWEVHDNGTMFDRLQESGAVTSTWQDITSGTGKTMKAIFKPIANAMQDFINLGKVYKEYSEEVDQANAASQAAKRKAQAAKERLLAIEAALMAGN